MPISEDGRVVSRKYAPTPVPWPRPPTGWVALSVDGSFSSHDGRASAGMVLRNGDGTTIFAAYRYIFHCNDAFEAEIHAIMQGMALAIQHSDMPVIVQSSDSSNALATLTDRHTFQISLWSS